MTTKICRPDMNIFTKHSTRDRFVLTMTLLTKIRSSNVNLWKLCRKIGFKTCNFDSNASYHWFFFWKNSQNQSFILLYEPSTTKNQQISKFWIHKLAVYFGLNFKYFYGLYWKIGTISTTWLEAMNKCILCRKKL